MATNKFIRNIVKELEAGRSIQEIGKKLNLSADKVAFVKGYKNDPSELDLAIVLSFTRLIQPTKVKHHQHEDLLHAYLLEVLEEELRENVKVSFIDRETYEVQGESRSYLLKFYDASFIKAIVKFFKSYKIKPLILYAPPSIGKTSLVEVVNKNRSIYNAKAFDMDFWGNWTLHDVESKYFYSKKDITGMFPSEFPFNACFRLNFLKVYSFLSGMKKYDFNGIKKVVFVGCPLPSDIDVLVKEGFDLFCWEDQFQGFIRLTERLVVRSEYFEKLAIPTDTKNRFFIESSKIICLGE